MILSEKYRPTLFEEIVGIDNSIPLLAKEGKSMPHFLFYGPPGTGKTTTAKVIIKQCNAQALLLNASDERGIFTVRDKIKTFAQTSSIKGEFKIVLLDEADALTSEAQDALRSIMELYSSNCKFILTANHQNKIIDAIQSRCARFQFKPLVRELIIEHLKNICISEKIGILDDALGKLIDLYGSDIRKMLNKLQELSVLNKQIAKEDITSVDVAIPELWQCLIKSNSAKARQIALDSSVDYSGLLEQLYDYMIMQDLSSKIKSRLILRFGECNRYLKDCIEGSIEFSMLIEKIVLELKEEKD